MKKWFMLIIVMLIVPMVTVNAEQTNEEEESLLIEPSEGLYHQEIEEVQLILDYIEKDLSETFETMYIDWESSSEGVYTFLFSGPIKEEELDNLHALANDMSVAFTEIDYTKEQLEEKHLEILETRFDYDDFSIRHVGPDMAKGYVVIGIDPYTETNAQILYDQFGHERVTVEEGHEISTMDFSVTSEDDEELLLDSSDSDDSADVGEVEAETISVEIVEEDLNWFQRLWRAIKSWLPF